MDNRTSLAEIEKQVNEANKAAGGKKQYVNYKAIAEYLDWEVENRYKEIDSLLRSVELMKQEIEQLKSDKMRLIEYIKSKNL